MRLGGIIGIIGGGQLGKMMQTPANNLGFKTLCYSDQQGSPALIFAHEGFQGSYMDKAKIMDFASKCDLITIEFENISRDVLKEIENCFPSRLFPRAESIIISQNRLREKTFLANNGIKISAFDAIGSKEDAKRFFSIHGKFILKTSENGYDGKGQYLIEYLKDLDQDIPFEGVEMLAEKFVPFSFEASVILTRNREGQIIYFPIPVNIHKNGILHRSIITFKEELWKENMRKVSTDIAHSLNFVGTMAVEFFILHNGEIMVNEIAPRPHNSGHFTLDLTNVSQFENHIRAVADLPMIQPKLLYEGEMLNLIGREVNLALNFLDKENAKLHIYGKKEKEGRKMGHINFIYE